jgi:UDP-glucose 4-epimerase
MPANRLHAAIFGSNGFLGRHLARELLLQGHEVCGYDLREAPDASFSSRPLDVTDREQWESVSTDVDTIFYFSGLSGTLQSFENPAAYTAVNEQGLQNLLDVLKRRKHHPRVVFPSSRLVYKGRPEALEEDAPKEAKTVYAANKLAGEFMLQAYSFAWEIPYTICRICVPYGCTLGDDYSYGTIGAFIRMAEHKGEITLYGDGSPRRTFTHVQDVCSQIAALATNPQARNEVFNVAGQSLSLRQAADAIARKFDATVSHAPWPALDLAIESGDTVFDDSKIRRLISRPLSITFEQWIQSLSPA